MHGRQLLDNPKKIDETRKVIPLHSSPSTARRGGSDKFYESGRRIHCKLWSPEAQDLSEAI
jgi:hypothetical protein